MGQSKGALSDKKCNKLEVSWTHFDNRPMLVASTAHFSKFVEECKDIYEEIGIETISNPAPHEGIENCKVRHVVHKDVVDADYQKICNVLENFVDQYFG